MSSLTHPHVVPNISLLHWNTKQNKLKNVFAFAIKVSGVKNTIVWTKKKKKQGIFPNIFFYGLQKKSHAG